ncbi:MAG: cysteine desulfurase [Polyangiaceae bacterium]
MLVDAQRWRAEFPALAQTVNGHPLAYLDSASTAQKPRAVIDATRRAYEKECANVHRAVHTLGGAATELYEGVRERVRGFLNAGDAGEIVFTRGATEAINLVAWSFGKTVVGPGDEVLASEIEHHSNLVPWQMLCAERGAKLRAIPVDDTGQLDLARFKEMLSPKVKIVAVTHVSNALGTVVPVEQVIAAAQAAGAAVVVDGAQAVPHLPVDVRALGCDFYCFSGHKLFGPTGTGVLYGKAERLREMPPWQGGGSMILSVSFDHTVYSEPPQRFEAGTPNIAGIVGLGAAIDFVEGIGQGAIGAWEHELVRYATDTLSGVPGLRWIGTAERKAAILSFVLGKIHPHDVATVLDHEGVAVRAGHHCAEPAVRRFGVGGTVRASFALYNTPAEVDALARGLRRAVELFA